MTQHDAISCRLNAARWRLQEVRARYDRTEAMRRKDSKGVAAAELWAEICALRQQAWEKEAERV